MKRSRSRPSWMPRVVPVSTISPISEVPFALAVFHRRLGEAVVGARRAALGDARRRDLLDHLVDRGGPAAHRARARHVADRAEADGLLEDRLAGQHLEARRRRVEHPVALEPRALAREVELRDLDLLLADVLPHVELGPVREREDAEVLALLEPPVVEAP